MQTAPKAFFASLLLALPAYAQMMEVPTAVQPPAGQKAAMTWTGTGELSYQCRAKADNAAMFAPPTRAMPR